LRFHEPAPWVQAGIAAHHFARNTLAARRGQEKSRIVRYDFYFFTAWSEAILPSRMNMMRWACCAISCS
jgi:hypothetical protein